MEIKQQLGLIVALVDSWDGAPSALERDLVLEKLRTLYESVLREQGAGKPSPTKPAPAPKPATPSPEPVWELDEPAYEPEPTEDISQPEPDEEPFVPYIPNPKPVPAPKAPKPPTPSPILDPTLAAPEPARPAPPDLFDVAPEPVAKPAPGRIDKRVILSLYGEGDAPSVSESSSKVLGDVLKSGRDDMATRVAAAQTRDLRSGIGINDKFLIISEVFGGSAQAYERTLDELDAFTDLDEAMIHIHDTYGWNPHNEGVKTLVEILTRKLS